MNLSLKKWVLALDFDQKNVLRATSSSLLLVLLLFLIVQKPDEFFISYCVLSWGLTYAFSWRNRTTYSKKKFRSKNGKVFSLKDNKKYWKFFFVMLPVTFLIAGPILRLVDRSVDVSSCMFGMVLLQMLCSRVYLFRNKIPLRAFTFSHSPVKWASTLSSSNTSLFDYSSPMRNTANAFGNIGPWRDSHHR